MNSITKLESCIEPVVKLLFDFFDSRIASSPGKVNLSVWLRFFASDAVGKLAVRWFSYFLSLGLWSNHKTTCPTSTSILKYQFGSNFNFLVLGSDPNRLQLAFLNLSYMGCVAGTLYRPFSTLAVRLMWRLSEATPKVIREAATAKTNERFEQMRRNAGGSDNEDMLSGFIACKRPKINEEQPDSKEGNDTLTRKEVAAQASSVFGAGSDTTSGALNGFFYCILKHPRVYAKLMKEVDETYAELGFGPLDEAQDEASALKYAQGVKMEYFQACLKESLRLVTPIGMEMPRVVPEDGLSGVTVGTSAFVYHRTEGAYGNDAAEFRPERWLGLSEEDRAIMERNFLTFGAGSTACIGRNISLMEITKVIPPLLHRYWFRIPSESPRTSQSPRRELSGEYSPNAPWSIRCHWLFETDDFWVEISRRNPH
ncbi:cytochrome P450 [Cantharellus anzutake]|uniref:cytochrome P450 n=1 Tax=Cantharellus anzutake TaxID=1750568 RepID=UPI001904A5FD|nr:cytochrome P450 [Cantharellus anzutake]KAF8335883.1 cytochrome P450 [Cantharellus anzutake]